MRRILRQVRDRARAAKNDFAWKVRKRSVAKAIEPIAPMPAPELLAGSTVFFVPYAGVTPMFSQACVLARTMQELGHRVFLARCFRLFDRCPVMDMHRLPYGASPEEKLESCLRCADNALSMPYFLPPVDLRTVVTPAITARIETALAAAPADLLNFRFAELPFGVLSAMDVILGRKTYDFASLTDLDRQAWLEYLRSCMLSHLIVDRLCGEMGVRGIVHANDYSLLLGARTAADKHGVPCHGLGFPAHRNIDFRCYLIIPTVGKPALYRVLSKWPECRGLALEAAQIREIGDDLVIRMGGMGSHLYSPPKTFEDNDVRQCLGLPTDRKLLVVYTSSLDEKVAAELGVEAMKITIPDRKQPFADQIEWLGALCEFVDASDDLEMVVRIHPREGANKRESVRSGHLARLHAAFDRSFAHCRFVWPEEKISSYDLGEAADVVLASWTSIGLEMARLAVPVLVAFNGSISPIPWDDFLEWAEDQPRYFAKLRELLEQPITLSQVARAYRWYQMFALGLTLDFSDLIPHSNFNAVPPFRMPCEAQAVEQILIHGQHVCELNVERLKSRQRPESVDLEAAELRHQCRRLVHFLMTASDGPPDGTFAADGHHAEYRSGSRIFRRYSPMAVRLDTLARGQVWTPAASIGAAS